MFLYSRRRPRIPKHHCMSSDGRANVVAVLALQKDDEARSEKIGIRHCAASREARPDLPEPESQTPAGHPKTVHPTSCPRPCLSPPGPRFACALPTPLGLTRFEAKDGGYDGLRHLPPVREARPTVPRGVPPTSLP